MIVYFFYFFANNTRYVRVYNKGEKIMENFSLRWNWSGDDVGGGNNRIKLSSEWLVFYILSFAIFIRPFMFLLTIGAWIITRPTFVGIIHKLSHSDL